MECRKSNIKTIHKKRTLKFRRNWCRGKISLESRATKCRTIFTFRNQRYKLIEYSPKLIYEELFNKYKKLINNIHKCKHKNLHQE